MDSLIMNEQLIPLLNSYLPASQQAISIVQSTPTVVPMPVVPPIPYFQNETKSEGSPKQQNLPDNGNKRVDHCRGWKKWKAAWEERLMSFIPKVHHHKDQFEDEDQSTILTTSTSSPSDAVSPYITSFQTLPYSHPRQASPFQTQVHISNGASHTVVSEVVESSRPSGTYPNAIQRIISHPIVAETEIGIARLHVQEGLTPTVRSRQGSKDSGINKSSDTGSAGSFIDSDSSLERSHRPTTLLLRNKESNKFHMINISDDYIEKSSSSTHNRDNVVLRKPKQRVKTPILPMNPHFSLYDDSFMVGKEVAGLEDASLSRSLPLNMNIMSEAASVGGKSSDSIASTSSSDHNTSMSGSICQVSGSNTIKSSPGIAHV